MASVIITINTDGPAFHDGVPDHMAVGEEVAQVLRVLASDFYANGVIGRSVRDSNGEVIGKIEAIE